MLPQHVLLALVATVAAVPLNINLGAYSPALVVGDGEISLGEAKSASELMATLASGANAAGGAAAGGAARQGQQTEQAPEAAAAETQEQPTEGQAAKRAPNLRRAIGDYLSQRAPAQEDKLAAVEGAMQWIKRDLAGFQAALNFAREAQKDAPKVEMGSPNAGVGLIVSAGVNVPANSAANGAPAPAAKPAKRDEGADEGADEVADEVDDEEEVPKMTLVAITEV